MKSRVLTALALIPLVLGAVFCTALLPFLALLILVLALGADEISRLVGTSRLVTLLVAFGLAGGCAWLMFASPFPKAVWAGAGAGLLMLGIAAAWLGHRKALGNLAAAYVVGPCLALLTLHLHLANREELFAFNTPVLLALLPLWGGDTAAIFAGKAFGKTPLAPSISPKKTVEGAVANLLACVLVAVVTSHLIGTGWAVGLTAGFAAGILGQAGDLFESALKRREGLKDSGTLLPGHGGILDRIDSLLFTAPAVALIVALAGR